MREAPAQREQPIERRSRDSIIGRVSPRERAVETAEHLARLAVRVLVRAAFVAGGAPLPLREIRDGIGGRALEVIGEVSIVHLDLLDDRTELADEIDRNGVRDKHLVSPFLEHAPLSP